MNVLSGVVHEIVYTGSNTTYHVELPNSTVLMVRQQNVATLPDTALPHRRPGGCLLADCFFQGLCQLSRGGRSCSKPCAVTHP